VMTTARLVGSSIPFDGWACKKNGFPTRFYGFS
jgi:hypothetical protein